MTAEIKDFGKEKVGKIVCQVFRENKRKTTIDGVYPPILRATIATYLFNLRLSLYYSRKIHMRFHEEKRDRRSYIIYSIANPNIQKQKESEGLERVCPLLDDSEIEMAQAIFTPDVIQDVLSFMKDDLKKGNAKFGAFLPKLYRQVHGDAIEIFKRLEMPLEEGLSEEMAIKALRDLRVANAVINQGIDYAFIHLFGIGRKRYRFFSDNMFKKQIEDFFIENVGKRSLYVWETTSLK